MASSDDDGSEAETARPASAGGRGLRALRVAASLAYFLGSLPPWFLAAVVVFVVDRVTGRKRRAIRRLTASWASHYLALVPGLRLLIRGREHLAHEPAVVVANHQSALDVLVLFALKQPFSWVAKREAFLLPFIGWNMHLCGYIAVDRGDPASRARVLDAARAHLGRGVSVLLFPEGTRSRDGRLGDFRHGAFKLACEADVPIVPIVIDGTRQALPRGVLIPDGGEIAVSILAPLRPADFAHDPERLRTHTAQAMADTLARERGETVAEVVRNPGGA